MSGAMTKKRRTKNKGPGFRLYNYDDWKWTYQMNTQTHPKQFTPVYPTPKFGLGDTVVLRKNVLGAKYIVKEIQIICREAQVPYVTYSLYEPLTDRLLDGGILEEALEKAPKPVNKRRVHGTVWELPITGENVVFFRAFDPDGTAIEKWYAWHEGVKGGFPVREITRQSYLEEQPSLRYKQTLIGAPKGFYTQFEMNHPGWEEK